MRCAVLLDIDACVTAVLSMEEAVSHPHHQERSAFVQVNDGTFVPSEQ